MSKMIEFSEQDYERIRQAAEAAGMPLAEWVAANLPLNGAQGPTETPASRENQPAHTMAAFDSATIQPSATGTGPGSAPRTMAERLTGRLGRVGSRTGLPSSDNVGESFAEYLEEKHRNGRL